MTKKVHPGAARHLGWFDPPVPYYERAVARLKEFQADMQTITDPDLLHKAQTWYRWRSSFLAGGYRQYLGIPHVHHILSGCATLYIGRQSRKFGLERSKWANPFKITPEEDRNAVIAKFRDFMASRPDLMESLYELQGHTLGCWCKTEEDMTIPCHGDVLAELYNEWAEHQWYQYGFVTVIGSIGIFGGL